MHKFGELWKVLNRSIGLSEGKPTRAGGSWPVENNEGIYTREGQNGDRAFTKSLNHLNT